MSAESPIVIDLYTDLSCPYCFLGRSRLLNAVEKLKVPVKIIYHAYFIDPNIPQFGVDLHTYYADHPDGHHWIEDLKKDALKDALYYRKWKTWNNTFNAQRLVKYVQRKKAEALPTLVDCLLYKEFEEGKNLSLLSDLKEIAEECGVADITKFIESEKLKQEVIDEDKYAKETLKITTVPYFIINGKTVIQGAENPSVFLEALANAKEEQTTQQ
ncbi:hypothetical protein WA158_001501 [Blastocystis sp. Blastoise]